MFQLGYKTCPQHVMYDKKINRMSESIFYQISEHSINFGSLWQSFQNIAHSRIAL